MTTHYTNTPIDHTSDAGFRLWGKEVSDALTAVGCTKTADTGQIDWTTVTRAGTNSDAGYEVWAMNDSLHATAPVFFKLYYGTYSQSTRPRVRIEVGTATDGAGSIVGPSLGPYTICGDFNSASTTTNRESYTCMTDGFVGMCSKVGYDGNVSRGVFFFFSLVRPCDNDGTIRSDAIVLAITNSTFQPAQALEESTLHFATGNNYTDGSNKSFCFVPNGITSSAVGTDFAAFKHYTAYPSIYSMNGLCSVLTNELGLGSTADCALNGATEHTYVCLGSSAAPYGITAASKNGTSPNTALCMLWE